MNSRKVPLSLRHACINPRTCTDNTSVPYLLEGTGWRSRTNERKDSIVGPHILYIATHSSKQLAIYALFKTAQRDSTQESRLFLRPHKKLALILV